METVKIGIVGVGAISGIYLQNITGRFRELEIAGVCDLIPERLKKSGGRLPRRPDLPRYARAVRRSAGGHCPQPHPPL